MHEAIGPAAAEAAKAEVHNQLIDEILTNLEGYIRRLLSSGLDRIGGELTNLKEVVANKGNEFGILRRIQNAVNVSFYELNKDLGKWMGIGAGIGLVAGFAATTALIATAILSAVIWPILIGVAILGICLGVAALVTRSKQEPERKTLRVVESSIFSTRNPANNRKLDLASQEEAPRASSL